MFSAIFQQDLEYRIFYDLSFLSKFVFEVSLPISLFRHSNFFLLLFMLAISSRRFQTRHFLSVSSCTYFILYISVYFFWLVSFDLCHIFNFLSHTHTDPFFLSLSLSVSASVSVAGVKWHFSDWKFVSETKGRNGIPFLPNSVTLQWNLGLCTHTFELQHQL